MAGTQVLVAPMHIQWTSTDMWVDCIDQLRLRGAWRQTLEYRPQENN